MVEERSGRPSPWKFPVANPEPLSRTRLVAAETSERVLVKRTLVEAGASGWNSNLPWGAISRGRQRKPGPDRHPAESGESADPSAVSGWIPVRTAHPSITRSRGRAINGGREPVRCRASPRRVTPASSGAGSPVTSPTSHGRFQACGSPARARTRPRWWPRGTGDAPKHGLPGHRHAPIGHCRDRSNRGLPPT